jgi:hypothetical protein
MRARAGWLAAAIACLASCSNNYGHVSFDRSSSLILSPKEQITELPGTPKEVADRFAAAVKQQGGWMVQRDPYDHSQVLPTDADECWQGVRRWRDAETKTYRMNDFGAFKKLDQAAIMQPAKIGCTYREVRKDTNKGEGVALIAELDQRTARSGDASIQLASRVYAWIFPVGKDRSAVVLDGVPRDQGSGVEASKTGSIGYDWWTHVTADRETQTVRKLFAAMKSTASDPPTQQPAPATASRALGLKTAAKMVVLPLKAAGGVEAATCQLMTNLLLSKLDGVAGLKTVGRDDLEALLGLDKQKQALGCDSVSCLAEIGGALGAELVLYGEIGRIGGTYNVNTSIVLTKNAQVAARASRVIKGSEENLADEVPKLVPELVDKLNR